MKLLITFFSVPVDQILTHLYTEMFLDMRLAFREAVRCISKGRVIRCSCCSQILLAKFASKLYAVNNAVNCCLINRNQKVINNIITCTLA